MRRKTLTMQKLLKLAEMKVLHIEPNDVIVLHTDFLLTKDQAQFIRERATKEFGASALKGHKVVVLTAGVKVGVLRKRKNKRT